MNKKGISFILSGDSAFFKKPEVNGEICLTYNNIHKPALLGLLGAILGLSGYANMERRVYPEFYEKLNSLKISIEPLIENGIFVKGKVTYNNHTGFASRENGGILRINEQWLYYPKWRIIIMDNGTIEFKELRNQLIEKKCVYQPTLGSSNHGAEINEVEEIELYGCRSRRIDSLFFADDIDTDEEDIIWFKEYEPIELDEDLLYILKPMIFTKAELNQMVDCYKLEEKHYFFY